MRFLRATFFLPLLPVLAFSQLTTDQKLIEFNYLADMFAKRYGPYEWKVQTSGYDMLDLAPWLAKVRATRNDLEYFDVAIEYVSRLNDGHSAYIVPSNFVARLNFYVDIYDGKILVDQIDRARLPVAEFGIVNGYELVSIDGVPAGQLIERQKRYWTSGNERTTRRLAAQLLTIRAQQLEPFASDLPEISTVVFRRPDDKLETYRIPWTKIGVPITSVGKFPELTAQTWRQTEVEDSRSVHEQLLRRLLNFRKPGPENFVRGVGSPFPDAVNSFGSGFSVRLTGSPFLSGVFQVGPYRIGFIRIPTFLPANETTAVSAFASEIAFFQANTDGLVVDIMRNSGGSGLYLNRLISYLMPEPWTTFGVEVRATSEWIRDFSNVVEALRTQGAPASIIRPYEEVRDALIEANRTPRGRTVPIDLDGIGLDRQPARATNGTLLSYRKPLMLLVDEMSASAADIFAALIQDNGRGPLFGWRTMGLGGNVSSFNAGGYGFGDVTITESLVVRSKDVVTPDFPTTRYIENVGVRPDIEFDYMTRSNLDRRGADFVEAFLLAMYQHIEANK
ncbi:MAG: hypothetical protein JNK87_09725 [Bryobacterales bacterium]|nr:hypothetical protein [Bryobacterales bacterium]